MPRLIFKCPYLKAGSSKTNAANTVRYISTRDGVDVVTDANRTLPTTQKQIIDSILRDHPDAKTLFEYEDYERQPTVENASEFIARAIENNLQETGNRDYYIKYIAERPGAEKVSTHGLFTEAGAPVVLAQVQREVAEHTGNFWTPIISIRREDAVRLSYDSGRQWQALLRSQAAEIATHMKIAPDHFRWYAAFHNKDHHPHVHMICWSTDPSEGFLTDKGIREIRSGLVRRIFRQDLQHVYEQQTDRRGQLNTQSLDTMREMCERLKAGTGCTPELEALILRLSDRLAKTSGKKIYGFLKPDVKAIVDQIVDELAKDERVAACYAAWYDLREEVLRTYQDDMPERAPLSSQKEFKQIKNMVIAELHHLGDPVFHDEVVRDPIVDATSRFAAWRITRCSRRWSRTRSSGRSACASTTTGRGWRRTSGLPGSCNRRDTIRYPACRHVQRIGTRILWRSAVFRSKNLSWKWRWGLDILAISVSTSPRQSPARSSATAERPSDRRRRWCRCPSS